MPEKAQVRSIDVLDGFRSNLIVYLSQARPALDEVSADVVRMRIWLESDQRTYWENQVRLRTKKLEQAQQALFSSRLGVLRRETAAEQMAVHRAKRALEEAETKLRVIKRWTREFEARVQPLVKQMEKLHTVFSNDMVKAVASLTQTIDTLAAYAELHAPVEQGAPTQQNAPVQQDAPAPAGQGSEPAVKSLKP